MSGARSGERGTPEALGVQTWRARLDDAVDEALTREIDAFEVQIERKRRGEGMSDRMFAETRLRRGVYGQRYDNAQRFDGERVRRLAFPCGDVTKGPGIAWDAPGMVRVKLPFGALDAPKLEALADCAEAYSTGVLHVTTRQDVQVHYVHIEDTPDLQRRLGAVGITTREACGNAVRNVVACPSAGVCHGEAFDVSPYAEALARYLLGHPDAQDMGRKFKVAFSGCQGEACGLTGFHDLGLVARVRDAEDASRGSRREAGFRVVAGGGLGAVPRSADVLYDFLPAQELLPTAQALVRVFTRHGERANRSRARLKFLLKRKGIDWLREQVEVERRGLRPDERWRITAPDGAPPESRPAPTGAPVAEPAWLGRLRQAPGGADAPPSPHAERLAAWARTNVRAQRQPGFARVTIRLPRGDLSAPQARGLAALLRRWEGVEVRATMDQNLLLRWVPAEALPAAHEALDRLALARAGAHTLADVTSCPGTSTCKLGIAASRGLAAAIEARVEARLEGLDPALRALRVKVSGCFNSCGQHHVADIGFLGVSRNVSGRRVPHFQVVLGGQWSENASRFGMVVGAVPSRRAPEVLDVIGALYLAERREGESLREVVQRVGRRRLKDALAPLAEVPSYEEDPSFYRDWGDPRDYSTQDIGVGECAGEVVPFVQMGLQAAEREIFEAQCHLDDGDAARAAERALAGMVTAAQALIRYGNAQVSDDPAEVVAAFRAHWLGGGSLREVGGAVRFAGYLEAAVGEGGSGADGGDHRSAERARQRIDQAVLFLEAARQLYDREAARRARGEEAQT